MHKRWVLRSEDYETSCAYRREFAGLLAGATVYEEAHAGAPELVFGELVTNAVRYGEEPMGVCVDLQETRLTIVVENAGGCADAEPRVVSACAEGGRGLHIVRALVNELAIERTNDVACRVTAKMSVRPTP